MSSMISKTYVNEIDVSKVKPGQKVELMVDAFPEKSYSGVVTSVANIGEQLPNADAKVFEVQVKVNESDPILRPSMTTGNKIITKTIEDVTYIPLESVQTGADSIPFVYTKKGNKQIVVLGEENENNVVVEQGIEAGTMIYLSTPENPDKFNLEGQDLIAVNQERAKARKEEERRIQEEAQKSKQMQDFPMREGMTPEMMQRFQQMRGNMPQGGMTGGQSGPRDTAAFRRMMRENPQGMQGMRRDTSARRRNVNQQGQGQAQERQNPAAGTQRSNQN
jgi:hypothetical protein